MLRALTFASPDPPEMTLQSVTCTVNEYSLVNVAVFAVDAVGEDVVGEEVDGDDALGDPVLGEDVREKLGVPVVGEEVGRGWQFPGSNFFFMMTEVASLLEFQ